MRELVSRRQALEKAHDDSIRACDFTSPQERAKHYEEARAIVAQLVALEAKISEARSRIAEMTSQGMRQIELLIASEHYEQARALASAFGELMKSLYGVHASDWPAMQDLFEAAQRQGP